MAYVDTILKNGEIVLERAKVSRALLIWPWIKGVLFFWLLLIPTIKAIKLTIAFSKIELALTNQRLVGRIGIVARQVMDSRLDKVQTVSINETFWGRIFHYANVHVTTAGANFLFLGIAHANEFKQKVMNQIDEYENAQSDKKAKALADAMK